MKFVVKFIFGVYILLALFVNDCDLLCFDLTENKKDRQKRLFLSRVEDVIFYTYPSICLFLFSKTIFLFYQRYYLEL